MTRIDFELEAGPEGGPVTTANSGASTVAISGGSTLTYRLNSGVGGSAFGAHATNGASVVALARFLVVSATGDPQFSSRHHSTGPYGAALTEDVPIAAWRHPSGNVIMLRWKMNNSCTLTEANSTPIGTLLPAGSDPTLKYAWTVVYNSSTGVYSAKVYGPSGALINAISGTYALAITSSIIGVQLGIVNNHAMAMQNDFDAVAMNDGSAVEIPPKALVASSPVRPLTQVSNAGNWSIVGGSASIVSALADELDSTYVTNPGVAAGEAYRVGFAPLSGGTVVATYRLGLDTGQPSGSVTVNLRENATLIATRTHAVTSTALATFTMTLTTGENSAIVDRAALTLEFVAG